MKIGIYDPYLDTLGGGERYMLTIAECLSGEHEVFLFWNDKQILRNAEVKLGINLKKIEVVKNIFYSNIFTKFAESSKYDIIFFLSDGSIPFVFSKLIVHFQHPLERVKTDSLLFKLKLSRVNRIICNSNYTKRFIDMKFSRKGIVLYPPFEYKKFVNNESRKENIILTVGRYSRMSNGKDFKKQSELIKAYKQMVDKGLKNWRFYIVTNSLPENEKYIVELGKMVSGYPINIYKNIANAELCEMYKKSKIYWHAAGYGEDLDEYPERAEHFGISTVEAMSAGSVPVVINAGGQKEIIKDGDNGFLWTEIPDLIDKTMALVKNEGLLKHVSQAAREDAKYFETPRFCRELKKIIRDL